MRHLQMTCEDAYRYVKAKRATISPNFNFLGQLLEYEKQLVQDSIIEKHAQPTSSFSSSSSSSTSHSVDFVLGPPPLLSPLPLPISIKPPGKRLNLSLRLSPSFESPTLLTSPKDSSPTTAMARLQFDKPLGKENRSGSSTTSAPTTLNIAGLSRPTRLVKEQNVTSIQEEESGQWESSSSSVSKSLTHHSSLSIAISKGFKCRKSSLELSSPKAPFGSSGTRPLSCDYVKKFKVHKIHLEGSESPNEGGGEDLILHEPMPSCSSSTPLSNAPSGDLTVSSTALSLSPVACYKREFSRSDSVSTSGIGSEISENELQASGSWEMSESGNLGDDGDGVFSDSGHGVSKSPRRQLQVM